MKDKIEKCDSIVIFGDEYCDYNCVFHCQLEKNHSGKHKESGIHSGNKYTFIWESKIK